MSSFAIRGARILADGAMLDSHALVIEHGVIAAILPVALLPAGLAVETLAGGHVLPGFVDTQVNGGGGVLLNARPSLEGIAAIAAAHRAFGTTALLPTLISDDPEIIARAIAAVDAAIEGGIPGVVGIHVEGPCLNPVKKGIHDARKFRKLDAEFTEVLCGLRNGRTLVTLAPECVEPGTIATLVQNGVRVAAGHTLADYDAMLRAVAEGLSGVTHLFNAMTQLGSREPGLVGAAIDLHLVSGLILDGHHVHPASARAAFRAKGADELMLVTDAMPIVGQDAPGFALGELWISAGPETLRGPDGTLAGSRLDMAGALRNAIALLGVDLATASHMASTVPAAFLGLSSTHGSLAPGRRADIVHLDGGLQPRAVWIGGVRY